MKSTNNLGIARLLGSEIVEQTLHGVHRRILDAALGNLADRRKRHTAFLGHRALMNRFGLQLRHHKTVDLGLGTHGPEVYTHIWVNSIPVLGFYFL